MFELIINIISSLIFLIIGLISSKLYNWSKFKRHRHLWYDFKKAKTTFFVLSTRQGEYPWSSLKVSLSEVQSYHECSALLDNLGIETKIVSSLLLTEEIKNSNLILIGSPVANNITQYIWNAIKDKHNFDFVINKYLVKLKENQTDKIIEVNENYILSDDNKYTPKLNDLITNSPKWIEDYGIIAKFPNPFNDQKKVILAMGCHGFSTYGSMKFMLDNKSLKCLFDKVKRKNFIAIINFRLQNNEIIYTNQTPSIVNYQIID